MTFKLDSNPGDQRAKALGKIWGAGIAMMALSIPLCAILGSALIPIFIILGVAAVSFYIWESGAKEKALNQSENESLRAKIKDLEERLTNVEVINRFEDRLAEKRLLAEGVPKEAKTSS